MIIIILEDLKKKSMILQNKNRLFIITLSLWCQGGKKKSLKISADISSFRIYKVLFHSLFQLTSTMSFAVNINIVYCNCPIWKLRNLKSRNVCYFLKVRKLISDDSRISSPKDWELNLWIFHARALHLTNRTSNYELEK